MRFACPNTYDADSDSDSDSDSSSEDEETTPAHVANGTNNAASIARQVRFRAFRRRMVKKKKDKRKLMPPGTKVGRMLRFEAYCDKFHDEVYWARIERERKELRRNKIGNPLATGLEPFFEEFIKKLHKKIYGDGEEKRDASAYFFPGGHPEFPMVESDGEA